MMIIKHAEVRCEYVQQQTFIGLSSFCFPNTAKHKVRRNLSTSFERQSFSSIQHIVYKMESQSDRNVFLLA